MEQAMHECRYINPLTDYGFKRVFGEEEIMREFLNDLIKPDSPIRHVIFLNKDVQPENEALRGVVYDMRCQTEDGGEIIVEMQNRGQSFFKDRILYYLAHSISPQGHKGRKERESHSLIRDSWDFKLKPVYGIFFLNFQLDGFQPRLIRTVRFMVEETNEVFNDKVCAYTVELPCMKGKSEADCKNVMDYWSYNLYNLETMNTQIPFTDQKPIFMKMAEVASYSSMSTEQQRIYMDSLNNYRTVMAAKEYDYKRGEEKGRAEGDRIRQLSTATALKRLGILSPKQISEVTGMTESEIESLL